MHRFLCVWAALCLLGLSSAFAQFTIVNNQPTSGQTGVELSSNLVLTFTMPLDTNARWGSNYPLAVLAASPQDSIQFGAASFSDENRTITIPMTLKDNTDYCIIISNARNTDGDTLEGPFTLDFTTADDLGTTGVAGSVTYNGQHAIGAIFALLAQPPSFTGHREVRFAAPVTAPYGNFGIYPVRNGVYWPVAAWDMNKDGDLGAADPQGFYDSDFDGVGDSIVVSGSYIYGLMITLQPLAAPNAPAALPTTATLSQNFPNPFNPTTSIDFTLTQYQTASLKVFDMLGREIATLASGQLAAGPHSVEFNAQTLPGGVYFYRLSAGTQSFTRKMLLLK
jgi:hypothetical protein